MNPAFKTIKKFNDLFESDKSKNKSNSSQTMWAIALFIDPNDGNPWKNLDENDKKMLIADEYLKKKDFKWEEISDLIEEYENRILTIGERAFVQYQRKMSDRSEFINKTTYTLDEYEEDERGKIKLKKGTADQLDKMMLATGKLYALLAEIKDQLEQESAQGKLRGGAAESASESGEI